MTAVEAREAGRALVGLPKRLHHTARVVKDHEVTRQFYEDLLGMPLIATWTEVETFPSYGPEPLVYSHAFYGLAEGGALAFFQFSDPAVYERLKPHSESGFNHLALAVTSQTQDEVRDRLHAAGFKTVYIDHGYFQSLYVTDPDGWFVEFTCDDARASEINEWQRSTAHETLTRWMAGDHTVNNTFRPQEKGTVLGR